MILHHITNQFNGIKALLIISVFKKYTYICSSSFKYVLLLFFVLHMAITKMTKYKMNNGQFCFNTMVIKFSEIHNYCFDVLSRSCDPNLKTLKYPPTSPATKYDRLVPTDDHILKLVVTSLVFSSMTLSRSKVSHSFIHFNVSKGDKNK